MKRCLIASVLCIAGACSTTAVPASASGACANVVFIGAAGSGELEPSQNPSRFDDMGPEVHHMAEVMQTRLAQRNLTLKMLPVSYPADSVNDLKPSWTEGVELLTLGPIAGAVIYSQNNVARYDASIQAGINATVAEATATVSSCPGTMLVLSGYSQGAIAVHDAEVALSASVLGHVAGTLILGDGDRVPNSAAQTFGTAPKADEGLRTYLHLVHAHDVPIPSTTAEICNADDIVCDFSWGTLTNVSRAVTVHTSYSSAGPNGTTTYSPLLASAALWLANKISPGAGRIVFTDGPGTGPPPIALGPFTTTAFPADTSPEGEIVDAVTGPTGAITFSPSLEHLLVGIGWKTWSNGYTGDVYWTDGGDAATISLPAGTNAFYFYAEPNEFEDFDVRATASNGTTTGDLTVYGDSGAAYFGFYGNGATISNVTITSPDDFAVGEFGISG
jgi:hypothetical protein